MLVPPHVQVCCTYQFACAAACKDLQALNSERLLVLIWLAALRAEDSAEEDCDAPPLQHVVKGVG